MTITITAEQRDALYGEIVVRLSGIDAIHLALQDEDYDKAERLVREYSDYLLFLLNDLGWGESSATHDLHLTTAPEVLRRALGGLKASAARQLETDRSRTQAAKADEALSELVVSTCCDVLGRLDRDSSSSR
jgi:hypothetical protein